MAQHKIFTNADGKTIGSISKDADGNVSISNNGAEKSGQALTVNFRASSLTDVNSEQSKAKASGKVVDVLNGGKQAGDSEGGNESAVSNVNVLFDGISERGSNANEVFLGQPISTIPTNLTKIVEEIQTPYMDENIMWEIALNVVAPADYISKFSMGGELPDLMKEPDIKKVIELRGSPVKPGVTLEHSIRNNSIKIQIFRRVRVEVIKRFKRTFWVGKSSIDGRALTGERNSKPVFIQNRVPLEGYYIRYKTTQGQKLGTMSWPTPAPY